MRAAIVDGETVENVVLAEPDYEVPGRAVAVVPEGMPVAAGWTYRDGAFVPPSQKADRAGLTAAINTRRDELLAGGFPVPAGVSSALAGEVLQTRDADDKVNWKLSRDAYKEAIAAGYGEAPQATFRTTGNRTITVTIREGFAVLEAMQAWGVAVLGRSWALKDAVAAASDADLDAVDVAAGWPT